MSSTSPGGPSNGNNTPNHNNLPRGILGRHGMPIARGARLPSVRTPRDLTLGGGAQKRTFTPNIPVRKDKQNDTANIKNAARQDGKRNQRQRGGNRGERGSRGRGRGRGENLIQTEGVFTEGPMAAPLKKGASARYESDSKAEHMQVPKFVPKANRTQAEKDADEQMLKNLYRDDFISDLDDERSKKVNPVQLPLMASFNIKKEVETKPVVKIKTEPKDENNVELMDVDEPNGVDTTDDKSKAISDNLQPLQSITELLSVKQDSGMLLMFQFPDNLPGVAGKDDDDDNQKGHHSKHGKNMPSTSKNKEETEITAKLQNCSLADLPEGFIGKLQILKSGKARLKLGSVYLDVELGTKVGFQQDLVSINASERDGDMIVLGRVQDNLVCRPDMESLLQNAKGPT